MTEKSANTGQGLGIAGLVLGIIALVISFIPCIGMYAIVPGVLAITLSAIGFSQANKANASKGLIIAALVVSIAGTTIAVVQYFVLQAASEKIEQGVEGWSNDLKSAIDDLDQDGTLDDLEDALNDLEEAVDDATDEVDSAMDEMNEDIETKLDSLESEETK